MTNEVLSQLIKEYKMIQAACDRLKPIAEKADSDYRNARQQELEASKQILEAIGFDTDNFRGGIYNFTDEILPFLEEVTKKEKSQ